MFFISLRDSNQQTPEQNTEENRWSCVYDNDFVQDMRESMGIQEQQNKTFGDKECEIVQPVPNLKYGKVKKYIITTHWFL